MAVLKYYNTATSAWEYIAASTTANFTTWKKTAAGGETSVSGTDDNAVTLSYTVGLEQVFINGVLQVRGSDYTATNGTSVTGLTALVAGDIVTVVCYAPFNIANTIAPTVVDAKGDLLAGTAADTVGRLAVGTNGQVLAADSGETTGLKWSDVGMTLINPGGTTLSGASVSISSIPSTYKHLRLLIRNVYTSASENTTLRFNSDSGSNYYYSTIRNITTTLAGGNGQGTTSILISPGNTNANTNWYELGHSDIFIPFYTGTDQQEIFYKSWAWQGGPSAFTGSAVYNKSAAITSITLLPFSGNWSGGTAYLYGVN
jgi:hypothetical protein